LRGDFISFEIGGDEGVDSALGAECFVFFSEPGIEYTFPWSKLSTVGFYDE